VGVDTPVPPARGGGRLGLLLAVSLAAAGVLLLVRTGETSAPAAAASATPAVDAKTAAAPAW
jgi:hypothetical protein